MATDELPAGWLVYSRDTPEGEHWTGEHYGPHGFTARLGDATEAGLRAKIVARAEYRAASGVTDPSSVSLRSVA